MLPLLAIALLGAGTSSVEGASSSPRVWVETSSRSPGLADALAARLAEELTPGALADRADAELFVRLEPAADGLRLTVTDRLGATVVERRIEEPSTTPAVRLAALLVREAAARARDGAPAEVADSARDPAGDEAARRGAPWTLTVVPWASVDTWWRPVWPPELGVGLSLELGRGRFVGGVGASATGLGCCARDTSEVRGRASALAVFAEAGVVAVDRSGWSLTFLGAAGVSRLSVDASGVFPSPGTTASFGDTQPFLMLLAAGAIPIVPDLALTLRAGARVAATRPVIGLPSALGPAPEPLDPGAVTPWAAVGVAWRVP